MQNTKSCPQKYLMTRHLNVVISKENKNINSTTQKLSKNASDSCLIYVM